MPATTPTATATATETAYLGGRAGLAAPLMGPESAPPVAPLAQPVTITHRVISYAYDALVRLTAAEYSTGESFAYTYDPVGNRLSLVTGNGSTSYEHNIRPLSIDKRMVLLYNEVRRRTVTLYTANTRNRVISIGTKGRPWLS